MDDSVICDVETTMKYVVRGEEAVFYAGEREKSYWPVDERRVTIHDVRPHIGELTGGVFGPPIAGRLADTYGLDVAIWIQVGLAAGAGLAALLVRETNPAVIARRQAVPA